MSGNNTRTGINKTVDNIDIAFTFLMIQVLWKARNQKIFFTSKKCVKRNCYQTKNYGYI